MRSKFSIRRRDTWQVSIDIVTGIHGHNWKQKFRKKVQENYIPTRYDNKRNYVPVSWVWQNSTRSRTCRANFSRVHRVQYDLMYHGMPIERLSIKRMRVLGAFSAVLDDLNFKFSQDSMPPGPPMFMLHGSAPQKKGCKQDYRQIASPFIRI